MLYQLQNPHFHLAITFTINTNRYDQPRIRSRPPMKPSDAIGSPTADSAAIALFIQYSKGNGTAFRANLSNEPCAQPSVHPTDQLDRTIKLNNRIFRTTNSKTNIFLCHLHMLVLRAFHWGKYPYIVASFSLLSLFLNHYPYFRRLILFFVFFFVSLTHVYVL